MAYVDPFAWMGWVRCPILGWEGCCFIMLCWFCCRPWRWRWMAWCSLFGNLYYCEMEWWSCVSHKITTTYIRPFNSTSKFCRKIKTTLQNNNLLTQVQDSSSTHPYEKINTGHLVCKNTWHYHQIITNLTESENSFCLHAIEEKKKNLFLKSSTNKQHAL